MADWSKRRHGTPGYNVIMGEIRQDDISYDPWGTAMEWLLAIAEVTYVDSGEILAHYRPSPMRVIGDRDTLNDSHTEMMIIDYLDSGSVTLADLADVYRIMGRFDDWCRIAGRDY